MAKDTVKCDITILQYGSLNVPREVFKQGDNAVEKWISDNLGSTEITSIDFEYDNTEEE